MHCCSSRRGLLSDSAKCCGYGVFCTFTLHSNSMIYFGSRDLIVLFLVSLNYGLKRPPH